MPKKSKAKKFTWDLSKVPLFMVWNRVKSARENLGLTQIQLAAKAGISAATLTYLETGTDAVTTTGTKEKLARFFRCEVSDLFPVQMVGPITKQEYLARKISEDQKKSGASSESKSKEV